MSQPQIENKTIKKVLFQYSINHYLLSGNLNSVNGNGSSPLSTPL